MRLRDLPDWVDARTGLIGAVRHFFLEQVPASSGWPQVFGSVALFLILLQAFTGILLAFNFGPTSKEAYDSLRYILTEVTGGRLVHELHHWGASLLIVVVFLHLAQVFLYGAYKRPREATWIAGVVLLVITLSFALTGYLLPWDNRAYWGTMVTTQIAGRTPLIGPYLIHLLGAQGGIGALTYARFYSLHVLVLPPLVALFIVLHVALVRRHGVAPAADDFAPRVPFFPKQALRDTVAIFIAFAVLFTLAATANAPLERIADPTDTTYVPRPEWYFLWLFQLLRVFQGPLEIIAGTVLPALAIAVLFAMPFLDRGHVRRVTQRTAAFAALSFAVLGWAGLTFVAVAESPASVARADTAQGSKIFADNRCAMCHSINGAGGRIGPPLNGVEKRHTREWIEKHFDNPQALSPGSIMPAYHFSPEDLKAITDYLESLPEK